MAHPALMDTYNRLEVCFESGNGPYLTDAQGKRYLDALCGIGVCGLGHAHPGVTATITQQAGQLIHTSNLYTITQQERLAEALVEVSGMAQVFFSNSGAEANEAAIKLARLFGHQQDINTPSIIVLENAFHGRTLATLTASGNRKIQAGFEPLVTGFVRAPFNDIEAIKAIAKNNNQVVAVLFEAIQGEGGLHSCSDEYLQQLRALCDHHNWLMMMDEVQTGNGRTGQYFAYQHSAIQPDVVTTAKGLGNGMPIGACLVAGKAKGLFHPGNHGSTYGGSPLACAVALTVVQTIVEQKLALAAAELGKLIQKRLKQHLSQCSAVEDIRGRGLMIGIALDRPCGSLVKAALEKGLLINVTAEKVIRLLPPLILSQEQALFIADTVAELIQEFTA